MWHFTKVYVFVCTIVVCGCICLYVYVPPMRKSGYADHCEVKSSINQSINQSIKGYKGLKSYVTRFARRVLYTHHFNAQILSPLNSHTNVQAMHGCMIVNSSSVCFSQGCFLEHVKHPCVFRSFLIGSAGCQQKATGL